MVRFAFWLNGAPKGSLQPWKQYPHKVHPVPPGATGWPSGTVVKAAVPPGWRMAFSWAWYDGWETFLLVLCGMPSVAAPAKNTSSLVPSAAVCTGRVASAHS